jgi:hypothetical protein
MSKFPITNMEQQAKELLEQVSTTELPLYSGRCLLHFQNQNLGHLLNTERAGFYLNILYSLLMFRRNHELEPLHEDILLFVLTAQQEEAEESYDAGMFNQDMRQLEKWELVTQRIERERLRGYKDSRRKKFRYRISAQALSFLQWLEDQMRDAIAPQGTDTRNLLEEVAGCLQELQRTLNKIHKTDPNPDRARTAIYQLSRLGHLTLDINQSLADFNSRLVTFTLERYDFSTAREIINELDFFLKNYINRIQLLRRRITPELEALASPRFAPKWELCKMLMAEEKRNSALLMRGQNVPEASQELIRLIRFYELSGQLDQLCARVRTSAQNVWRKLYTHLRELERKSHRMEDIRARIEEMAALPEDTASSDFINELISPARMIADMHFWNAAEKADPPQPRLEQHKVKQAPINYIQPKADGDPALIRSLNEENLLRLQKWIEATHSRFPAALSKGNFNRYEDHLSIIEIARNGILSNKRRLAGVTGLRLEPTDQPAVVEIDERILEFKEMMIVKANQETTDG